MFSFKNSFYLGYFLLPVLMFMNWSTSFMLGTLILCVFSFTSNKLSNKQLNLMYSIMFWTLGLFIVNFLMMLHTGKGYDISRFFLSVVMIYLVILSGFFQYNRFLRIKNQIIDKMMFAGYLFFIIIAYLSFVPFLQFNSANFKSVFPFNEPSHFAIYLSPIILYNVYINKFGYIYVIPFILFALLIQNFTILIVVFIALLIKYKTKTFLFLPIIIAYLLTLNIDFTYFEDRLKFNDSSDNLSMLVYRQGIDIITYTFNNLNGIGIGFQQLGFNDISFETSEILRSLLGKDMNLTDGGFTAAKIIGEFGFLASVILFIYFKYFFLSLKILFKKSADNKLILSAVFVVSYVIELFVRGVGYFNVSLLFLIVSVLYIKFCYKLKNESNFR